MNARLILASASPRRRRLLAEAGYRFEVDPSGV
ncbi:MAG: Maf family protein, partial [Planctomycetaceae bacterium]|nr:Maf family protein [Planctomycetaceae bacterium]